MKRVFVLPVAAALIVTLGGAMNLGPHWSGEKQFVIVDRSDSCAAPAIAGHEVRDSDLGAALASARRAGATRVVLYTDGCDPAGTPAVPPGMHVDVVLCPRADDIGIAAVEVPDPIPPGAEFAVEIVIRRTQSPAAEPLRCALRLFRDGAEVGSARPVVIGPGQRRRVRIPDRIDGAGVARYRAELSGPTGAAANDRREAVAVVGSRPRVLSLTGPLRAADLDVVARRRVAEPETYAAILVADPPTREEQQLLLQAVRGGTGLVVLGGSGYAGGPLDPILPLTDRPPGGRATVVLIDFSGSMAARKKALLDGVRNLLHAMAPDDQVAAVVFGDTVRSVHSWSEVRAADWDLAPRPQGSTRLAPALAAAKQLFAEAGAVRTRRLFVVSDGEWKDPEQIPDALAALAGVTRVAVFVPAPAPPFARSMFPRAVDGGDDLARALEQLEERAADRVQEDAVDATQGNVPDWLAGAVPGPGSVPGGFVRLHAKQKGEAIALEASGLPLIGAWRPGGKVVVAAAGADPVALLRACLRDDGGTRLRARRRGRRLEIDMWAKGAAAVSAAVTPASDPRDAVLVPLRLAAPGHARGVLDPAPDGVLLVRAGAARLQVAAARERELEGAVANEEIAAALARAGGGTLHRWPAVPDPGRRPVPAATLLLAAVLLLAGAAWRR